MSGVVLAHGGRMGRPATVEPGAIQRVVPGTAGERRGTGARRASPRENAT